MPVVQMTKDEQPELYKERFKDAWNALKVIRDAVEQHAPPGTLKSPEYLDRPSCTKPKNSYEASRRLPPNAAARGCSAAT